MFFFPGLLGRSQRGILSRQPLARVSVQLYSKYSYFEYLTIKDNDNDYN